MSGFSFLSLSGQTLIDQPGDVGLDFEIPVETDEGYVNIPIAVLKTVIIQTLDQRVTTLEMSGVGGSGASIWPVARTLTLTGPITGSVSIDGSQNVSLATSVGAGALSISNVSGLSASLATQSASIDALYRPYREVTANGNLDMGDIVTAVTNSGAITLQLPTINAALSNRPIVVYRRGVNPVTVKLAAGQTLENNPDDLLIDYDYGMAVLAPTSNTNWRICNRSI